MSTKGKAAAGKKGYTKSSVPKSAKQPAAPSVPANSVSSTQAKVQLFWLHSLSSLYRPVPASVLREIGDYMADPPLFVLITPKSISALNLARGVQSATVQIQSRPDCWYQTYTVIDAHKVLCCGGMSNCHSDTRSKLGNASKEVFIVAIATGRIESLPRMQMAREQCGLIVFDRVAYVFGGTDRGAIRPPLCAVTCEMLRLTAATAWEELGNMSAPRVGFNPSFWRKEIYLCDGSSAEIFTPKSLTFRPIPLDLSVKIGAIVYVLGEKLIVLSSSWLSRLKYEAGALVTTSREHEYLSIASHCPPVVWEGRVYVHWHGRITVLEAETGRKLEERDV